MAFELLVPYGGNITDKIFKIILYDFCVVNIYKIFIYIYIILQQRT